MSLDFLTLVDQVTEISEVVRFAEISETLCLLFLEFLMVDTGVVYVVVSLCKHFRHSASVVLEAFFNFGIDGQSTLSEECQVVLNNHAVTVSGGIQIGFHER